VALPTVCHGDVCYVLKDLQMVNISLRVLSRPDARMLPTLYRSLGIDYDERVLPSICNEVSYTERVLPSICNEVSYTMSALTVFYVCMFTVEGTAFISHYFCTKSTILL